VIDEDGALDVQSVLADGRVQPAARIAEGEAR
jgi:hypothetical protein